MFRPRPAESGGRCDTYPTTANKPYILFFRENATATRTAASNVCPGNLPHKANSSILRGLSISSGRRKAKAVTPIYCISKLVSSVFACTSTHTPSATPGREDVTGQKDRSQFWYVVQHCQHAFPTHSPRISHGQPILSHAVIHHSRQFCLPTSGGGYSPVSQRLPHALYRRRVVERSETGRTSASEWGDHISIVNSPNRANGNRVGIPCPPCSGFSRKVRCASSSAAWP